MKVYFLFFLTTIFSMSNQNFYNHEFSLYAPKAKNVTLVIFKNIEDSSGVEYSMKKNGNDFVINLPNIKNGTLYGFKVQNLDTLTQEFSSSIIITDPYSKALATQNHYSPVNKSIVYDKEFVEVIYMI